MKWAYLKMPHRCQAPRSVGGQAQAPTQDAQIAAFIHRNPLIPNMMW
jgi:hypothetical protein